MSSLRKNGKRSLALLAGAALAGGGALMGATSATAEEQQGAAQDCAYGDLCLWPEVDYGGDPVAFFECTWFDIGDHGEGWAPLSSFNNNQWEGTESVFYTWDENNPDEPFQEVYRSVAPEAIPNVEHLDIHAVQTCPAGLK
ncbi:hypothetical protein IQ251_04655 [Saccharopolyspora sp. HNM0983]|uniref:Peptidase inhibitor family I36 n=1 Tax=Saccharopolyspora montiporae TaxID=2781240 RepID=A0A929B8Y2_9PSEU|nr:hypothetical protein [Saccharopolyspora sp. HNM0983]MBE9373738.1 hypothetical protein [Saccharopolyspora sp. HNM0983]